MKLQHIKHRAIPYAMGLTIALTPMLAQAQISGGGGAGGGLMSVFVNWIVTNIVAGAVLLAVLFIGALLMMGRASLGGVVLIIAGAVIMSNYQAVASLFGI